MRIALPEQCDYHCRMTRIYVENQGDRVFVWACLTDRELAAIGEPYAYVRPGEKFGGVSYQQLVEIASGLGVIDAVDLEAG